MCSFIHLTSVPVNICSFVSLIGTYISFLLFRNRVTKCKYLPSRMVCALFTMYLVGMSMRGCYDVNSMSRLAFLDLTLCQPVSANRFTSVTNDVFLGVHNCHSGASCHATSQYIKIALPLPTEGSLGCATFFTLFRHPSHLEHNVRLWGPTGAL